MPVDIYKPKLVHDLEAYYGAVLFDLNSFPIIRDHLHSLARKLHEGLEYQIHALYLETNNYHPNYLGMDPEKLKRQEFDLEMCQQTIAAEFGFRTWDNVEKLGNKTYNFAFEDSVNTLLNGDIEQLHQAITEDPSLTKQQSQYGHRATLLHYTASNGVEFWRQKVPMNLVEITRLLLDNGADPAATMNVYGGQFTTYQLLTTGAHPYDAGIGLEMEAVLSAN